MSGKDQMSDTKAFFVIGLVLTGFAAAVVGLQIYIYLQSAIWLPLSVMDVLQALPFPWFRDPQSWFGLHELLRNTALSFGFLCLAGFFYLGAAMSAISEA